MLRDEAIETLLGKLETTPRAELTISVESGYYFATFEEFPRKLHAPIEGDSKSNLTDALVSVVERMES